MTNVNNALTNHLDAVEPMHIDPVQGLPDGYLNQIINYNPDVLTCLANLSNDEVFTPPALVNQMLDMLPADLWTNKNAKFLDPVTKSGVFLREIVKRLIAGLEIQIPDLQTRINHICTTQVYGIAITELTSLLARRSLYCAKNAGSPLSICTDFEKGNAQGNIRFERVEHSWANGKCFFCGASQAEYDRDDALENHAYRFIHTDNPSELFGADMKFDVIIGNPPYQLSDGSGKGGAGAVPIYQKFVQQAKKLNPTSLIMIIPARWFSGGRGLDEFRDEMLNPDDRKTKIVKLIDYFDSGECFPGVDISGGICYFLWNAEFNGDCEITTVRNGSQSVMKRPLLENNITSFIRFNEAVGIFRKICKFKELPFNELIGSAKPFGFRTFFIGKEKPFKNSIKIHTSRGIEHVDRNEVLQNPQWVKNYKVYISYAYGERGSFPYLVLGKPFVGEPDTCCTETYLHIGPFASKQESENVISYMTTKFFRFLVLLKKNTQHATKSAYSFVPTQDYSEPWTDEKLYAKYGLTADEIAFIESMIRPMDLGGANDE